jgi:hypothetical protein
MARQWSVVGNHFRQLLPPGDPHAFELEWTRKEPELGVDKTDDGMD